ncbi:MAG: GtrA family protein [Burkholderiales bacterium]|nr:GtrA family protein [Burkholderiales bacterium]
MRTRGAALARYVAVGGAIASASAVGIAALVQALDLAPVAAAAVIAVIGNVLGFVVNREWSFLATHEHPVRQFLRYSSVSLVAVLASVALFAVLTDVAGLHYAVASFVVSAVFAATNFLAHFHWSFAAGRRARPTA